MDRGEIYRLGNHRLMCGDATNKEDIERLVGNETINLILTDPPYGCRIQNRRGQIGGGKALTIGNERRKYIPAKSYPQMIGDTTSNVARKHYEIAKDLTNRLIIWGGQYFTDFLPVSGGWLFWDKDNGKSKFSDGELAWTNICRKLRKYKHMWNGICREGNRKLNSKNRLHPTQKPVELHMKILEDFTQPGDVILDCFGGSGTTLIAAELTGRTCLMMEISSDYCGVIKDRYEKLMPLFKEVRQQRDGEQQAE